MEAKLICPHCGNESIVKDIGLFINMNEKAWELLELLIKKLPEDMRNEVAKKNNVHNLKKELEEKGHLRVFCSPCISYVQWKIELEDSSLESN